MKELKPSIGRFVFFYPTDRRGEGDQPLVGIVVHVWDDRHVNLAVFDRNGTPMSHPPTNIRVVWAHEKPPEDERVPYCTYRSYRPSEAAKAAKVARRIITASSDFA